MAKTVKFRSGLSSLLFWSIIAAAFIGPGTVTTAARSGAGFGLALLWALLFSIVATIILQEAAARITIASGKSLGEIITLKFQQGGSRWRWLLFIAVAFGCAAYQAGNILGAVSGLLLFEGFPKTPAILAIGLLAALLLWQGSVQIITRTMGAVVALMGIAFIYVALGSDTSASELVSQAFTPSLPEGSAVLVVGLIGTTIVPYNLFLASGISEGQDIPSMRWGITLAVIIGGIISIAIMVVGTQVEGAFSFGALADTLSVRLGQNGRVLFALGLFAAGITSSVTAPLAAAITARSLLGGEQTAWSSTGRHFRLVWGSILLIGIIFGLTDVQPVPAIILAQAINGVLLPLVAVFLYLAVNDKQLLGSYANTQRANLLMLLIVGISLFLGLNNLWKAFFRATGWNTPDSNLQYWFLAGLALLGILWLGKKRS